jgi:hypothetical protein
MILNNWVETGIIASLFCVAFVALVALLIVLVDLEMAQYKEERR